MVLVDQSVEMKKRFDNAYQNIKASVQFDIGWRDEQGYLSNAVQADLKIGEVVKSVCPDSGRRVIMVGTPLDTVVVFERYPADQNKAFKLVYNSNDLLQNLLGGSFLSIAQFSLVITDFDPRENIGTYLDKMNLSMNRRGSTHHRKAVNE